MGVRHQHISQLDWHELNAAVSAGSVSVDAATNEVMGSYTLQRHAIEARVINPTQSRLQWREALLQHFNQLAK